MDTRIDTFRMKASLLMLASIVAMPAAAAHLELQLDGVEGPFKDAAVAAAGMQDYASRDITAAQARRLFDRAPANIASALEPYGYYNSKADGELKETPTGFVAVIHVHVGEPTTVAIFDVIVPEPARDEKIVRKALATFTPKKGERLDHANYEKSKAAIQAALLASGYLDAKLTAKTVEVSRSDNRASIHLSWDVGPRYRYGKTTFTGGQFQEGFLDRYVPWHEGDFYSQDDLLRLQQQLIDADYFAVVDVQPEPSQLRDGIVPILVTLGPAKRNVYTAGVFLDTDIGFGVRGGLTRRWLNDKGHKLKVEVQLAQKLRTASVVYSIPLPGPNNRAYNFGVNYLNENTDTTISHTESVVANETREWLGFTRTLGLHLLTGTFDILDPNGNEALEEHGNTTLLYPELVLEKKKADDPLFVRDGYSLTLTARGAPKLVSETEFAQVRADAKWIKAIARNQRIIFRGSVGATQVGDFDKLPPELRFFAGGDRSIRGYSYQTIGPENANGLILGGEDLIVGSAEYEYYFTRNWGIAVFADAGDAFTGFSTYKTHIGSGLGLRWRSPVGMVRVDLGTPIRDPDGRSGVELHLTIGPDL
ncbi:MAG TPA: autotransporter assembly complex family protein [Rudaea sp.]|jgi:translocation and assembly module TamA|nr:autotransporter assembly complex family protein [Rudaea sp.]